MNHYKILWVILLQTIDVSVSAAVCRLSNVYQSHMVLQRAPQVSNLYGFADPNTIVTTIFRGNNLTSTASSSGEWRQALPATSASSTTGSGETISFSCSNDINFEFFDYHYSKIYNK
jgi:hypothetical protein